MTRWLSSWITAFPLLWAQHCLAQTDVQTFDDEGSAAAGGWTAFMDAGSGNDYGFRGTDVTGGASDEGEAGGVFARHVGLSYYADTDLGGVLTPDDEILAFGEFAITSVTTFNQGSNIVHFSTTPAPGENKPILGNY